MSDATQPKTGEPQMNGNQTNEVQTGELQADGMPAGEPMFDYNDAHFVGTMRRSMRNIAVLGVVLAVLLTIFDDWRTGLMLLIGAGVSFTGVWEWRRLVAAINSRLDEHLAPQSLGRTIFTFLLRLTMVGAVLYGSLRYLEGSVYALIAGLSLAMVMLTVEVLRMPKR